MVSAFFDLALARLSKSLLSLQPHLMLIVDKTTLNQSQSPQTSQLSQQEIRLDLPRTFF